MLRAIALGRRALGATHPNPPVGAVVVSGGRIVGAGFHERAGAPHAEAAALIAAGERAKGSELFVSLEPCNHHGRTPPCTEAIVRAGISRVVYAVSDPNPKVSGGGGEYLQSQGLVVERGICKAEGEELLAPWSSVLLRGRPYLTLKLAISTEGLIAPANRGNVWLSSPVSLAAVQRLRSRTDAILVGANTVRLDNPRLTNRLGRGTNPLRVVVTGGGTLPDSAVIFDDPSAPTLVASPIVKDQAQGIQLPPDGNLLSLMNELASRGISSLLCEGGGMLAKSLIAEGLVDRLILFKTPASVGANGVGWWPEELHLGEEFELVMRSPSGADIREEYKKI